MTVVTRFAPSPTGYLHIGGARTAIFNYLFAKHFGGKFLLRVEDTDKERSTDEATSAIFAGLEWLGIEYDETAVFQSKNISRHRDVAELLLKTGKAYKCFMTQDEIDSQRQEAINNSTSFLLKSPWRENNASSHPDKPYAIRIKAPRDGNTIIDDIVQGEVVVENKILDDLVLLRADGTPTYMLAVVVDDHDMGVTHIIRGDDHLNNAFRQKIIYEALGWDVPKMAHIPLIHGQDGAKLSKRHGAVGVEAYRDMGYLPEAIFSYLLRLGWSHENEEVITKKDAIKWFDGSHIGKAPSRIDFNKMKNVNSIFLRKLDPEKFLEIIKSNWNLNGIKYSAFTENSLRQAMLEITSRSELTTDLSELALIYHEDNIINITKEAQEIIDSTNKLFLEEIINLISRIKTSDKNEIQDLFKSFAESKNLKLGEVMKIVRAYITGKTASPSVFEIIAILGSDIVIKRLEKFS
jgi:glutamyl-tRNA synthetase